MKMRTNLFLLDDEELLDYYAELMVETSFWDVVPSDVKDRIADTKKEIFNRMRQE